MHPILGSRARLGTYLLGWVPVAGIFIAVCHGQGWTLAESAWLSLPSCLLAAFLFLSSWYLCKAFPLRSWRPGNHAAAWGLAAAAMASLWTAWVWLLAAALKHLPGLAGLPARLRGGLPMLLVLGSLHYLTIDGLLSSVGADLKDPKYCLACFNGEYVIPPCAEMTKNCLDETNALTW